MAEIILSFYRGWTLLWICFMYIFWEREIEVWQEFPQNIKDEVVYVVSLCVFVVTIGMNAFS